MYGSWFGSVSSSDTFVQKSNIQGATFGLPLPRGAPRSRLQIRHSFLLFENADYVDRGAWSVETYALLLAWKALLPKHVILIRGNHETKYCAHVYGFKQEVESKYGAHNTQSLFKKILVSLLRILRLLN
jgi:hypothetical protein